MRHLKHNSNLCSRPRSGKGLGLKKSKFSQLKNPILSWPLLFLGVFLFIFLGFSPLRYVIDSIKANYSKTETIRLYPRFVDQDKEPDSYENGWWNQSEALMVPSLKVDSGIMDFNDANSSFYTGGNYSLGFSGFYFLEEELGKFEEGEEDKDESDFNTENSETKSDQIDPDNDNLVPPKNDPTETSNDEVEIDSGILSGAQDKKTQDETSIESSQSDELLLPEEEAQVIDIESGEGDEVLIENGDYNQEEELLVETDDLDTDNDKLPVTENTQEYEVDIEGDLNDRESGNEDDLSDMEVETDEESYENTSDEEMVPDLSLYPDLFFTNTAKAEEVISSDIESLNDLGTFKSATIKVSLALNELENEDNTDKNDPKEDVGVDNEKNTSKEDTQEEIQVDLSKNASTSDESTSQESKNADEQLIINDDPGQDEVIELDGNSVEYGGDNKNQETVEEVKIEELESGEEATVEAEVYDIEDETEEVEIIEENDLENSSNDAGQKESLDPVHDDGNEDNASTEPEEAEVVEEESKEVEVENSAEGSEVEELSIFDFVKRAQAQSDNFGETKLVFWYAFADNTVEYETIVWKEFDSMNEKTFVNAINGDYLQFDAPFLQTWDDIENLHLKVEARETNVSYIAYLDAMWVEAEYEPSEALVKINERKEWEKAFEMISSDMDLRMDEQGRFKFRYQKNRQALIDSVGEMFGLSSYWENIEIEVFLVDSRGTELDLPVSMIFEEDGEFEIILPDMPRGFKPGKYSMVFRIKDSSSGEEQTINITQDFSWGVLAFNTNKSVYGGNDDSAYLQMAVLDDFGRTICNADLSLDITSPDGYKSTLSTANGMIVRNPECGPDNVIDSPDYYSFYMIDNLGQYQVTLTATTTNGVYRIQDSFSKNETNSFDVEREGPSRIYPLANYDMSLLIKADDLYEGDIYEFVPKDFEIASQTVLIKQASSTDFVEYNKNLASSSLESVFKVKEDKNEKTLSWSNIKLDLGEELLITYEFDAPDVSPEFFLLGELSMDDWREERQWQIASDAIYHASSTNGVHVGWINQNGAWDAENNNQYAYRTIFRKTIGGETANYIQSNANTALNLGGDINSVEVGIEGYVESNEVSAYIVPYFGGSTAGSQYIIAGTTLGVGADDDLTDYVDITNSSNAPTTWTWADIQNLDIRIYGENISNSRDRLFYIDQIRIRVDYTANSVPDAEFVSAVQRLDDSGVVDITAKIYDSDNDDSRARLDYVSGSSCDFSTPLDPSLDESEESASSSPGDIDIDNEQLYQIGTTTGYITMLSGSSTINFDWLSASNTNDTEGVYCLQLTATDNDNQDLSPATTTLVVDNKAPSKPGIIEGASSTKSSVILYYGATSTDLYFNEYRIYYATSTNISEEDYMHASTTDANLADVLFNGEATTTITGLDENTTYYFSVFAYDDYGHFSSSTVFSFKTNKAPTSIFSDSAPASQRTDGSGKVDISIEVDDLDNNDSKVRIDYVQGADCDFSSPLDPSLDESPASISSSYGVVSINNANTYQIGNSAGYVLTPATNTVTFVWDTSVDISEANDVYCMQIRANDLIDDQNYTATTTLVLDTLAPSAPGVLVLEESSTSTLTLAFGATTTETNFSHYKIFYKAGTENVSESNFEHLDANLSDKYYNGFGSTTIENLSPNTNYVINIWAYDDYGNKASSTEVSFKTDATVSNNSLTFINPAASNWAIADGSSVFSFEAVVTEGNGWTVLDKVELRLANKNDDTQDFEDLIFSWDQTNDTFSETGTDLNSSIGLAPSSSSNCLGNTCTLSFDLVFNDTFASSSYDYAAELYSTNDSAVSDSDVYPDFYQVKIIRVEQVHYRWRNDDGGE